MGAPDGLIEGSSSPGSVESPRSKVSTTAVVDSSCSRPSNQARAASCATSLVARARLNRIEEPLTGRFQSAPSCSAAPSALLRAACIVSLV